MRTILRRARTLQTQKIAPFTGEGAYHGSTRVRPPTPPVPRPVVDAFRPRTLDAYARSDRRDIGRFAATFPNRFEVVDTLPVPSQREIQADAVTLCWCPFDLALAEAGPLTRRILEAMAPHLTDTKAFCYVDAKIQHFTPGDLPVDSQLWHIDGSIVARDDRVRRLGASLLHDMRARLDGPAPPPQYLAYQSSAGCATQFATSAVTVDLPELIETFDVLDQAVAGAAPHPRAQPAASIVRFDGRTLHRARVAEREEWRLWVRCIETDKEAHLTASIIECYDTVFRTTG